MERICHTLTKSWLQLVEIICPALTTSWLQLVERRLWPANLQEAERVQARQDRVGRHHCKVEDFVLVWQESSVLCIDDLHQGGGDVWQEVRGSPTSHLTSCQAQTSPGQGLWAGDPDYSLYYYQGGADADNSLIIIKVMILLLLLMLTMLLMTFDSWGS